MGLDEGLDDFGIGQGGDISHVLVLAGGDVSQDPAHDLARARLGQPGDDEDLIGCGHGADDLADLLFEGAEKVQDICAAELDDVDGADEVIETFRNMAAYMTKMTESMPMGSDDDINPGELMNEIDGFPVHTIDYENGTVMGETSLDSVTEQDFDWAT